MWYLQVKIPFAARFKFSLNQQSKLGIHHSFESYFRGKFAKIVRF